MVQIQQARSPLGFAFGRRTTRVYSGLGADTVMQPFQAEEFPRMISAATGVEVNDILDRWMVPDC